MKNVKGVVLGLSLLTNSLCLAYGDGDHGPGNSTGEPRFVLKCSGSKTKEVLRDKDGKPLYEFISAFKEKKSGILTLPSSTEKGTAQQDIKLTLVSDFGDIIEVRGQALIFPAVGNFNPQVITSVYAKVEEREIDFKGTDDLELDVSKLRAGEKLVRSNVQFSIKSESCQQDNDGYCDTQSFNISCSVDAVNK